MTAENPPHSTSGDGRWPFGVPALSRDVAGPFQCEALRADQDCLALPLRLKHLQV